LYYILGDEFFWRRTETFARRFSKPPRQKEKKREFHTMSTASKRDRLAGLALALCGSAAVAFASPMIEVDSADFNMGVIHEGKATSVKHVFNVRNSGDSVLVIKQVHPG
jgi:hypothetical protein